MTLSFGGCACRRESTAPMTEPAAIPTDETVKATSVIMPLETPVASVYAIEQDNSLVDPSPCASENPFVSQTDASREESTPLLPGSSSDGMEAPTSTDLPQIEFGPNELPELDIG